MINRRKFLAGLVAVPTLGIVVPNLGMEKFPNIKPTGVDVVFDTPTGNMLLVCKTHVRAVETHRAMGSPTNVTPIGIGGPTHGRSADLIVIDDLAPFTPRGREWWNTSVLTRRVPDGEIAEYKQQAKAYPVDYNNQCGIGGTWKTRKRLDGLAATIFHKPVELFNRLDSVHASATQIMYLAKKYHGFKFKYAMLLDDPKDPRPEYTELLGKWYNSKLDQTIHKGLIRG